MHSRPHLPLLLRTVCLSGGLEPSFHPRDISQAARFLYRSAAAVTRIAAETYPKISANHPRSAFL